MTDIALVAAIKYVQTQILTISGIRAAPNYPPNAANVFPFCIAYPGTGTVEFESKGWLKFLHTIDIDFHAASKKDLARDLEIAIPYVQSIVKKIMADPTLGGNVSTFYGMTFQLSEFKYAEIDTIGWKFVIQDVKIQVNT